MVQTYIHDINLACTPAVEPEAATAPQASTGGGSGGGKKRKNLVNVLIDDGEDM